LEPRVSILISRSRVERLLGRPNPSRALGEAAESDMGALAPELLTKGLRPGRAEGSEGRSGDPTEGASPALILSQVELVAWPIASEMLFA
jgi:hypothetical protein